MRSWTVKPPTAHLFRAALHLVRELCTNLESGWKMPSRYSRQFVGKGYGGRQCWRKRGEQHRFLFENTEQEGTIVASFACLLMTVCARAQLSYRASSYVRGS